MEARLPGAAQLDVVSQRIRADTLLGLVLVSDAILGVTRRSNVMATGLVSCAERGVWESSFVVLRFVDYFVGDS